MSLYVPANSSSAAIVEDGSAAIVAAHQLSHFCAPEPVDFHHAASLDTIICDDEVKIADHLVPGVRLLLRRNGDAARVRSGSIAPETSGIGRRLVSGDPPKPDIRFGGA
jgi:hypothetical protein